MFNCMFNVFVNFELKMPTFVLFEKDIRRFMLFKIKKNKTYDKQK